MKKSTKALLMSALCFCIAGMAFCIVSVCFGFTPGDFRTAAAEGKLHFAGPAGWGEDVGEWVSDAVSEGIEFDQSFEDVKSLELEIGTANCTILPSEDNKWHVTGTNLPSKFKCKMDGKTLKIDSSSFSWKFWNTGNNNTELEIYIPAGQILKDVDIEVGVGELEMADTLLQCKELKLDCGVGSASIYADVSEEADIDGGVGSIYLTLIGESEDFNYEIDCGVGSVTIDDETLSALGAEKRIRNGADKEIKIDCGVGSVEVNFEEK